jgi:hypothetical protein
MHLRKDWLFAEIQGDAQKRIAGDDGDVRIAHSTRGFEAVLFADSGVVHLFFLQVWQGMKKALLQATSSRRGSAF